MSNYPKESSKPNCFKNQGSIALDYAVTSDDDSSKLFKTNILVYAVKSDDDKRPTEQADKIIKRFSGMYLQNLFTPDKADFITLKNLLPQL